MTVSLDNERNPILQAIIYLRNKCPGVMKGRYLTVLPRGPGT